MKLSQRNILRLVIQTLCAILKNHIYEYLLFVLVVIH